MHESDVFTQLDGIDLDDIKPQDISILVGANVPEAFIPLEIRRGLNQQPLALRTKFGWTLFGPSFSGDDLRSYSCNLLQTPANEDAMHTLVEGFWKQESHATRCDRDVAMSMQDKEAEERLEKCSKLIDKHYEVPMLWKDARSSLPDNFNLARKRFKFLLKRLRTNSDLYKKI